MKKLFVLIFVALFGIGLVSINAESRESRTIPLKHGVAKGAHTLIQGNGGVLYSVSGYASSSSCFYSIHDASSIGVDGDTTEGTVNNTLAEGGEATQYDSFPTLDFGDEGLPFKDGLIIMTTVCDVAVTYN